MINLVDLRLDLVGAAGQVSILKGVDLQVPAGSAVSVVGPSGSGKSSLIAVIAGIERATGGQVVVDGVDLATLDEDGLSRFRRGRLSILFQSFHLIPTLSALENVAVPLELMGRRDALTRAADALAEVGLAHRVDHYPGQMSGGEQQRTALARAIVTEPSILLADEPTGNLDRANGEHVMDLVFDLRKKLGTTLLLVTHDAALAQACDWTCRMEDGRIVTPPDSWSNPSSAGQVLAGAPA
ncbi:MAG TPA: ABC transporter ATP-binding protein [Geminicoccus sp.]|jgi:putative ABC transport system ATP-binding protein|uniref:ABC transporter ATP-binding protein n=1 Tax=Geminicoccus sp. TaxID=2024832 RepID=UPI002E30B78B|nr:ABC transporter ATP-binding protein [Geminicoccus sp.]HEX2526218.1 ABC transporter ATP-binding protein [Geminicoccus sp.]